MVIQDKQFKARVILSTLWVIYLINILYADVLSVMDGLNLVETGSRFSASDTVSQLLTPEILLGAAVFLETAILMVIFSQVFSYTYARWSNIIIATLQLFGLIASLFVDTPTIYYWFFAGVEVLILLVIIGKAWQWKIEGKIKNKQESEVEDF